MKKKFFESNSNFYVHKPFCNTVAKWFNLLSTLREKRSVLYFAVIDKTLKKHQIRPTKIRREILNLFFKTNVALSHADIVNAMSKKFDRVTIYRVLKLFVDNGLIHKVMDDSGVARFACPLSENNQTEEICGEHLHFKCLNCGYIFCLNSIDRNDFDLPREYKFISIKMTAEGICKNCNSRE
ncbi:MAG: transcriptional repressor [bacterium]|nr:MAG: transcriptional repressor [bacterium]